ncbi:MAG: hypothetical protein ACRC1T_04945 [Clostridium chrysemydis]|uniref:hypothetical protein n=1 Tax=Clostridium chrysemydis TaxID=2665504 RepID=UPI003F37291E
MINENAIKFSKDSIEDFNKTMTLFYGKETGVIRGHAQGRQDLSYYGDSIKDFNYDFIVVEKDDYVLNNLVKFIVKDGELMIKPETKTNKYKIASF